MNYKVYIQALNNFPIDDWAVTAYIGFKQRQADIYFFEDICEVPVNRSTILVASIEFTNVYLERLGLSPKMTINIPECLLKYAKREIKFLTVGEFIKESQCPIFVKPNGKAKEFVAGVVSKDEYKQFFFGNLDPSVKCMTSEVIDILSEYRCYVVEGELKGIKHYSGDIRVFPEVDIIGRNTKMLLLDIP
jgi:hypothetical protein